MPKRSTCISSVIVTFGALLLILGLVFLLAAFPAIFKEKIHENLVLHNGSDEYNRWTNPPAPIYTSFYLFDVVNKFNVNHYGDTPELEQLGPYVFREEKFKEVSSIDDESGRILYHERRTYHFDPNMSTGSLNDTINHVNVVSIALANTFKKNHLSFLIPFIRGQYIETHTVDELIFAGFSMKEYFPDFISFLCKLKDNCTFAFYLGKNGTTGKEFEVSSGVLTMDDFTEIKRYDHLPSLRYWYGDTCNQLNGTDGQQFPPGVHENDNLYLFNDDVCRSINIQYEQPMTVEGIDALRYVVPASVFADPNKHEENMCFCLKDETGKCPSKAGVISLATCQGGNPVLLSAPHFYQGEPEYWERFPGLQPNKTLHESFLDIEPITGTVIQAAKRLQINLLLVPGKLLWWLSFVKNITYFPVFWAEESGRIDPDDAAKFKSQVYTTMKVGKWTLVSITILGGVILLVMLVICVVKHQQINNENRSYKGLLEEDEVINSEGATSTEHLKEQPSVVT